MRKRVSRPRRFAAVDNDAIDGLPSILSIGLLTRLIRAKDGDDVTVETLSNDYDEGEKSLTKAMRALVEDAYVVKFKVQRATTEIVIEDGKEVVKRGGSWYTTFSVDSIPFSVVDVAAMVEEIYAEGNVKSHRVEPVQLDPGKRVCKASDRPVPPGVHVGPTCGNAPEGDEGNGEVDRRPTPPSAAPGRPTPGQGGAHIRKKTSSARAADEEPQDEDDALAGRSPGDARRASVGISTPAREGGSAASSKTADSPTQHDDTEQPAVAKKSSSKKYSAAESEQIEAVRACFPSEVREGLPRARHLADKILAAMAEGRTVEQMRDRIWFRWVNHGWADKHVAGELNPKRMVGPAVALVRPLRRGDRFACPDLRCENGADVDTKEVCRLCVERLADWRADRARLRAQEPPVGANSAQTGTGSVEAALPPQRAAQGVPAARDDADGELDDAEDVATEGLPWWEVEAARYEQTLAGREQHDAHRSPAPF